MIVLDTHVLVWVARSAGAPVGAGATSHHTGLPGDPADRVFAARAHALDAVLVTADSKLRSAVGLETIW